MIYMNLVMYMWTSSCNVITPAQTYNMHKILLRGGQSTEKSFEVCFQYL